MQTSFIIMSQAALAMPEEYPELERPPLRKIDKYCMPEVPCVPISKRFTQVRRLNIKLQIRVLFSYNDNLTRLANVK